MTLEKRPFWSFSSEEVLRSLEGTEDGLTSGEAARRLAGAGLNLLHQKKKTDALTLFLNQFKSPLVLILLAASILSIFLGDRTDAVLILSIVFASGLLGFWQERGAANAVQKLLAMVAVRSSVLRDGKPVAIATEAVVPGDIVLLSAGDNIPGDCLLLESTALFVNEASLTGETFSAEKSPGPLPEETPLAQRKNTLFMGTFVVSGKARAVVVRTGRETEFGGISEHLRLRPPETEFESGVRRFGYLLMEVTFVLLIIIFAFNVFLHKPVLASLLFSLALAVGLTPQLLPAIISINLAHGARKMARKKVIVKRLVSIENFGSMNVLCSDKTGTLTEGVVHLTSALDVNGTQSEKVLLYATLNAFFESGFFNPIDEAIRGHGTVDLSRYRKLDEEPYDFVRKRLSILLSDGERNFVVTKGALTSVLSVCSSAETSGGQVVEIGEVKDSVGRMYEEYSRKGFRLLGVACRDLAGQTALTRDLEDSMTFLGILVFADVPKPGIAETIRKLKEQGVNLKIITGDNPLVASGLSREIGFPQPRVLTGHEIHEMSASALRSRVNEIDVFAEVEPLQKELIISMLRKAGNVVGFMGDGINDASALHAADVGISVNSAVDVAKDAADIVLLERDLGVLSEGVREGRATFANTLKYVFMATSANFGNMFSMAGASLFLPFLPLLPTQILLTNLMTDIPEMTIATDCVDQELLERPRRWDIRFIRKFMFTFGLLSSVFDYLTFGVLLLLLHAGEVQFRTGWFLESVISASLIVLIIRTRKPTYKSVPGKYLLGATLFIAACTLALPYTGLAALFGFKPLPGVFMAYLGGILLLYMASAEVAKRIFYRKG